MARKFLFVNVSFFLSFLVSFNSFAQPKFKVIATEISRGIATTQKEYVELLVAGTKSCDPSNGVGDSIAKISYYVLYDTINGIKQYLNQPPGTRYGILSGKYRFPKSPIWDSVPYGSIILIYNDSSKNSNISYPDDSLRQINPNRYIIPLSRLEYFDRDTVAVPPPDSIVPAPSGLALKDGHTIRLINKVPYPYTSTVSDWADTLANTGFDSPGYLSDKSLSPWPYSPFQNVATKTLSLSLEIDPSSLDTFCPGKLITVCGKVPLIFPDSTISYKWQVNDRLDSLILFNTTTNSYDTVVNRTKCMERKLNHNDSAILYIKSTYKCLSGPDSISASYVAGNILPDGGFINLLIIPDPKAIIDTLGLDSLGNPDTSRTHLEFCKGTKVKLSPKINKTGPSDLYYWYRQVRIGGILQDTLIGKDSVFVDSLLTIQRFDTLKVVVVSSLKCVQNQIDTTTLYVHMLDSIPLDSISISVLDTNVCSQFPIFFEMHSVKRDSLNQPLLDGNGKPIIDSFRMPQDTTVKYSVRWVHYSNSVDTFVSHNIYDTAYKGLQLDNLRKLDFLVFKNPGIDSVKCFIYARKTASCPLDTFTVSNTLHFKVTETLSPGIRIVATQEALCPHPPYNDTIRFWGIKDTSKGRGNDSFYVKWYINQTLIKEGFDLFLGNDTVSLFLDTTHPSLKLGDTVRLWIKDSIGYRCQKPDTAEAKFIITDSTTLTPKALIIQNPAVLCEGYSGAVTYTLNLTNQGFSPKYEWFLNGIPANQTDSTKYVYSVITANDVIKFVLTSSVACADPKTDTAEVSITITPSVDPSVKITTPKNTICQGETVVISTSPVNGGNNPVFNWYINSILVPSQTGPVFTYTNLQDGDMVFCDMKSTVPCASSGQVRSDTLLFKVNPLPTIGSINGNNTVCVGATTYFQCSPQGGVWVSSNPSIATIIPKTVSPGVDAGEATGVNAGTTTISYSYTDANTCTNTSTLQLTVNSSDVSPIQGTNTVCKATSSQLSISPLPDGFISAGWTSSDPTIVSTPVRTGDITAEITGVTDGTALISCEVVSSCGITTRTYQVNVGPPVVANITGKNVLCNLNEVTILSNATVGGTWASSNPASVTIGPNDGVVTVVSDKQAVDTISYSLSNVCGTTTKTFMLTVGRPLLEPIKGRDSLCIGFSISLTDTVKGGTWSSSDANIASIDTNGIVKGIADGTTTISYSLSNACGLSQVNHQIKVLIGPPAMPPITTASNDSIICLAKTDTLLSVLTGGTWTSLDPGKATVDPITGVITGISNGLATFKYTISNGCGIQDTTIKLVIGAPIIGKYTHKNPICLNDRIRLTNSIQGATSIQWISGNQSIVEIPAGTDTAIGKAPGIAVLAFFASNKCSISFDQTDTLKVLPLPFVDDIKGRDLICLGDTSYYFNGTPNGVWSNINKIPFNIDNTGKVIGLQVGSDSIRYTIKDQFGCINVSKKYVEVSVPPSSLPPIFTASKDSIICLGSKDTLKNAVRGGVWSVSNKLLADIDSRTGVITGLSNGLVTVTYTYKNGCGQKDTTKELIIGAPIVGQYLHKNPICIYDTVKLFNSVRGATTIKWVSQDKSIAEIVGATGDLAIGKNVGDAPLILQLSNRCNSIIDFSDTLKVTALPIVGKIVGKDSICIGDSSLYTDSSLNGIWSNRMPTIANINANGILKSLKVGQDTLEYKITNSIGCSNKAIKPIVIVGLPVLSPITWDTAFCYLRNTTLKNSTPGGLWSSSDPTVIAFANPQVGKATVLDTSKKVVITYKYTNSLGCSSSIDTTVKGFGIPKVGRITGPDSVCIASNRQLLSTTPGGIWSSSDITKAIIDPIKGIVTGKDTLSALISYKVIVNGCDSINYFTVKINKNNVDTILGVLEICRKATTLYTNNTLGGIWNANGLGVIAPAPPASIQFTAYDKDSTGSITYTVINNCGTTIRSIPIKIGSPTIDRNIIGPDSVCMKSQVRYLNNTVIGSYIPKWSVDTVFKNPATKSDTIALIDSASGILKASLDGSTRVYFRIINKNGGCFDSVSKRVVINPLPIVTSNWLNKDSVCVGNSLLAVGSPVGGSWVTNNPSISDVSGSNSIKGIKAGRDSVFYQYTDATTRCFNKAGIIIKVIALPIIAPITSDSLSVPVGLTLLLKDTTKGGYWGSQFPENASIDKNGRVTALSEKQDSIVFSYTKDNLVSGCIDSSLIKIKILPQLNDVFFPNFFSPSSPNVQNKTFKAFGKYIAKVDLRVYSQWGQLLFQTSDKDAKGWDGTFSGKEQPAGVYVYVAKVILKKGQELLYKGSVMLIR